jgi:hypothetical protein
MLGSATEFQLQEIAETGRKCLDRSDKTNDQYCSVRNKLPKRLKSYRRATIPLEADWHRWLVGTVTGTKCK